MRTGSNPRGGYTAMGFLFVLIIVISSLLAVHTASILTVAQASAALDFARQNRTLAWRFEEVTREAVQSASGPGAPAAPGLLGTRLAEVLACTPDLADNTRIAEVPSSLPSVQRFPSYGSASPELNAPSEDLVRMAGPVLRELFGNEVLESPAFEFTYELTRDFAGRPRVFRTTVDCRLVEVPLSRYSLCGYDLPEEIGRPRDPVAWDSSLSAGQMLPRGLVPARDPATVPSLNGGPNRPARYRYHAAWAEMYQYLFSAACLNQIADFAGPANFVDLSTGSGPARLIPGGRPESGLYYFDLGAFLGTSVPGLPGTDRTVVFCSATEGGRLIVSDSGGSAEPVFMMILGPADATRGALQVEFASAVRRPTILLCANVQLLGAAGVEVNGAILLDPACTIDSAVPTIRAAHLSYWLGSRSVRADRFSPKDMPRVLEPLIPRAVLAAVAARET